MELVHNSRERWLCFQMHRYQHKIIGNTKKQREMAQSKEYNKSLETDSKELEVYELPD